MILSHKHKFIFIKTKKTAGTSIEIVLSSVCGPQDIITRISPEDELIRQQLGFRGPQNHKWSKGQRYFNHISAGKVREYVGEKVWQEYYTFCFERNPWDKVISWYYWELQFAPELTLDAFIDSGKFAEVGGEGGYDLYTQDGLVIVDQVCRYENLDAELAGVVAKLGLGVLPELPRAKSSFRTDKRHYREIISPRNRDIIARAFQHEIELFGYEF